ncbi:O-antigen ligase [Dyadobacter sp. BE34]|uniref:O-antigen ligase n=1 Tax=Dyadobacter fermentans TaxID=94254 RepID=A0ABU1R749_9BACT|nr:MULTISPECIES: O-antigen ligase family protein [Dyadobacter]MDR6809227.1 O-antigen ligase [Dyadobacter fermentans]MDR7046970.1 O-antigen ligase [Dyadobacter sp. BE242]MDR7201284.1 O-antigen ligase [Dyadobacter sp. BE34]MDR7219244.1 O-antigen ligase [Dyadobacter sp. BE31]MDR7264546.1 O-antigen ligase [Dyadobacter sp. BE32]
MNLPIGKPTHTILSGTLGSQMYIFISLLLFVLFLPIFGFKLRLDWPDRTNQWIWGTIALGLMSLVNPYNENPEGTLIALMFIISNLAFCILIFSNCTRTQLINGIQDGFVVLGLLNFLLAICFPVLGLKFTTTIFHFGGDVGATRMGTAAREGAIGLFSHPGNLALYSTISSVFFLSNVILDYKKKSSLILLALNFLTIILTYSRTTYVVYALTIALIYYIAKNPNKAIFSVQNIVRIFIPLTAVFLWIIVFSPVSDLFLENEVGAQIDNRTLHWLMAVQIFQESPLVGVGLNAHLIYFSKHLGILKSLELTPFFLENPIHNIHLVVLVELGMIGLVVWLFFLSNNIRLAKKSITSTNVPQLLITQVGAITAYFLYGLTGWAPFSLSVLPFFIFIMYFSIKYRTQ